MKLSPHFALDEFTQSQAAARMNIDNTPDAATLERLAATAMRLEDVRALLGCPLLISSGYRSPALNTAIGGARASQHVRGEAADFIAPGFGDPLGICRAIERSAIAFDQLIQEGGWVHISFVPENPRREVLTAHFSPRGVSYTKGLE
jgi:zinc D-Ala-D-Ala carboxypeptidase